MQEISGTELYKEGDKMAIKDFEMNIKNADGSYDILHPLTKAKNVIASDGKTIQDKLDTYEVGAWTPTLEGSTTAGKHGYHAKDGWYTRIGDIVIADFYISISTKDSKMSGQAQIRGLPFPPDKNAIFSSSISRWSRLALAGGYTTPGFTVANGLLAGYKSAAGSDVKMTALSSSDLTHGSTISGSAIYRIQK